MSEGQANMLVILGVATTAQAFAAVAMFLIPTLAADIKETMGLSSAAIGYHISLAFGMGCISSISVGGFTRRFGANRIFQLGQIILAIGAALVATAVSPLVTIGMAFVGFGFGIASPVTSIILAQFSSAARVNLLFSVKQMATPTGAALAGAIGPVIAVAWSWQLAFASIGVILLTSVLVLGVFRRVWDGEVDPSAPISSPWTSYKIILRDRKLLVLALTGFFYSVAQLGLTAFLVLFLVEDLLYSAVSAGLLLSLVHALGVVSRPIWGWCADCVGNVAAVLSFIGLLTMTCAALAASITPTWPSAVVYAVFIAFGAAGFAWSGLQMATIASLAVPSRRAETLSGAFGLIFLGAWAGPGLASAVFSAFHTYTSVFVFLGLSAFVGTALTGFACFCGRRGGNPRKPL